MAPDDRARLEDRIRGCLGFAALGDAAGEPVEERSRAELAGYEPLERLRERGAVVTDDTGQIEALARALVASDGELTEEAWRAALLDWFRSSPTAAKAGPTTRAMLEGGARPGDERVGVTNGSAMRAAPCGLVHPGDPEAAVRLAWLTSRPTHDTEAARAAAGAVAAGVAVALRPGSGAQEVAEACVRGAAPPVDHRIHLALAAARGARDLDDALQRIEAAVGTSLLAAESVPAAVGVFAAVGGDPIEAVRAGVRIGGDTDTIAAMAGALAGALHGYAALDPDDRGLVDSVLPPALAELVPGLAALAARRGRAR